MSTGIAGGCLFNKATAAPTKGAAVVCFEDPAGASPRPVAKGSGKAVIQEPMACFGCVSVEEIVVILLREELPAEEVVVI